MRKVYKYFSLYREFFKTSLSRDLSFRSNFLLQSLMNISFMGMYFFTSVFIFHHIEHIGLWNKTEFFFFLSFVFAVDQNSLFSFFSFNFLGFLVRISVLGQFRLFIFLKPFSSFILQFCLEIQQCRVL